jgi:chromosome transmission fidelity protein 4
MKGNRRYLAFNLLGVVYSIDQSTHSTVHIEFHDRAQRPIHFSDHYNYGIAAMGDQCAVFASEASSTNPSTIYYKPYESWGGKNDWMMQLSLNENVKGIFYQEFIV